MTAAAFPPSAPSAHHFLPHWLQRGVDSFAVTLGGTFVVLLIVPFEAQHIRPVVAFLLGGVLVFTLWTADLGRWWPAAAAVVSAMGVALVTVSEIRADEPALRITFSSVAIALCAMLIFVLAFRVAQHRFVDLRTVTGALAVYMLFGLLFAYVFVFIEEVGGVPFFSQPGSHSVVEFLYYSFSTLTTAGFGDLTAANDPARMASVIEALIGQLYLVTVVALVVSNIRRGPTPPSPPSPSTPSTQEGAAVAEDRSPDVSD